MWASSTPAPGNIFFTDDPKNMQTANDHGIVVGTSHHEPMQRATNEWNVSVTGPWNWALNKANITKFMEEGVARARNNESYFTLGMRGLGDDSIEAHDAVEVLTDVFKVQRGILKKHHGAEDAVPRKCFRPRAPFFMQHHDPTKDGGREVLTPMQEVWTLYKETLAYYNAGLNPPDDITLLFPDDNFGNVHRLPIGNETQRKGGAGVSETRKTAHR